MAAGGETVFTLVRQPFVVPNRYKLLGGDPQGAQKARVVRVQLPTRNAAGDVDDGADVEHLDLHIRQFPNALGPTRPRLHRVLFARLLKLHTLIPAELPNVLPLLDVYRSPHTPHDVYCAFPRAPYSLGDAIKSGIRLEMAQIVTIAKELLACLSVFHQNGIVLTNLRPESVSIDTNLDTRDAVQLVDLSRCVLADKENACRVDEIAEAQLAEASGLEDLSILPSMTYATSSLWYKPPELIYGDGTPLTPAADMWSLGCVIGELISRRTLFPGTDKATYAEHLTSLVGGEHNFAEALHAGASDAQLLARVGAGRRSVSIASRFNGADVRVVHFLSKLLCLDPTKRATAADALKLPMFGEIPVTAVPQAAQQPIKVAHTTAQQQAQQKEAAAAAQAAAAAAAKPECEPIPQHWALPLDLDDATLAAEIDDLLGAAHSDS